MGLYDSFIVNDVYCPECNFEFSKFHTKALYNELLTFKIGDVVEDKISIVKDGRYYGYTFCDECNSWISAELLVINNIFVGIQITKVEQATSTTPAKANLQREEFSRGGDP